MYVSLGGFGAAAGPEWRGASVLVVAASNQRGGVTGEGALVIDGEAAWDLAARLRAVNVARTTMANARRGGARPNSQGATNPQRDLLAALEAYVAALQRRHQPVPYRVRDELVLYRSLFQSTRRAAADG